MATMLPLKNKLVQDAEGNEENRYPVSDSNKTKTDYPKELNKAHKSILKKNLANHLEFHGDVTRQGQPKCIGGTQEITRK
jgi:uncharacterized C2H2 Zn-finger protein